MRSQAMYPRMRIRSQALYPRMSIKPLIRSQGGIPSLGDALNLGLYLRALPLPTHNPQMGGMLLLDIG